ncbi:DNase I-like protein [Dentipellis sp. KUC8613]|nr:DNase I-like protein [Dentipellis sp. KUC8613]
MPGNDVADYFAIRNDWFHQRSHTVVSNDIEKVHLRVRVGSFNVNGKLPSQDLSSWVGWSASSSTDKQDEQAVWDKLIPPLKELSPLSLGDVAKSVDGEDKEDTPEQPDTVPTQQTSQDPVDPDLLVFGFQELDLSTEALLYSTKTTREEAWTEAIFAGLGDKREMYGKLVSKQLVGMLLLVFVKKDLEEHFAETGTSAVGAGIMGIMGNKGATAIRLTYRPPSSPEFPSPCPTTITIVNAHLAAYDEMYDRRNADFHDISRRLGFTPSSAYVTPLAPDGTPVASMSIYRSDALIWMGGVDPDVRSILSSDPLHKASATLMKYDQLKTSMQGKEAFVHYTENPIAFPPTYRYNTGLMTDAMGYDLKRKPAWTDRILHMTSPYLTLQQDSYSSHPEITMSDHKPVSADFSMTFAKADCLVVDEKANALYESVAQFDPEEVREVPTFEIESPVIELGNVSYEKPIVRELKIKNISKVPSAFRFYPHDLDQPTHPDWLQVEPMTGLLLPSEELTLRFTIFVSRASPSTPRLNIRADSLEYMVILHTVLGKDHFIALAGVYEPTCFANTLSTLTRLPGPIRNIQHPNELLPVTQPINAPKEVMRLVNWLMSDGVGDLDDLFFVPGAEETVYQIRECLDTDSPFPDFASTKSQFAHAIATALLALLDSLVDPVIPYGLHSRCATVISKDDAFEMLDAFPGEAINVWISVTAFLHYLATQTERKHEEEKASLSPTVTEESTDPPSEISLSLKQVAEPSRAAQLAAIFAPILLRDELNSSSPVSPIGKRRFLQYFIE